MIAIQIYTPSGSLFSGDVDAVFLPGASGPFEVLKDHAPLISSLVAGEVRYRIGSAEESISIKSGFMRHDHNTMVVCVEL